MVTAGKDNMEIHIICCNDALKHVVIGGIALAKSTLETKKEEYYMSNKHNFDNRTEYNAICYWHIHSFSEKDITMIQEGKRLNYEEGIGRKTLQ